jgi:hypothetical protein
VGQVVSAEAPCEECAQAQRAATIAGLVGGVLLGAVATFLILKYVRA